jgi:hypothetical protein
MNLEIQYLIDMLVKTTKSGEVKWKNISTSNNSLQRTMIAKSPDGTEFKIEIKYSIINDNLVIEEKPSMFIKNDLLPDKIYYLLGTKWNLKELRNVVKDMYAPDMNPTMDSVMSIIKTITKNISPSTWRDDNINKIIE